MDSKHTESQHDHEENGAQRKAPVTSTSPAPDEHAHQRHSHHEAAHAEQGDYAGASAREAPPEDAHVAPSHTAHGGAPVPEHDMHAGYGVMHEGHAEMMRNRFWVCLPLTIIVVLYSPMVQQWLGFTAPTFPGSQFISPILGTVIFFYGGLPFLSMARQELAMRQPGMMTLISLAITVAYVYSLAVFFFPPAHANAMGAPMAQMDFFWELATLITVMLLGHWIELRSVGQAQGALSELAKLLPDTAERILPDGNTEVMPVNQLRAGDRVLIRPGASIPADGVVIAGESSVNEAMITGESKPVHKHPGETVIGGTVNDAGSLRVEVQQVGEQTALAGIMRLVQQAQNSRSRAQTLAQRAAFYLTVIAIVAGVLTLIGWLAFTGSLPDAVRNTVTVLVIACPHALGLAVPLVIAISTTLSARNGLLVRDRLALENAKDLDLVIFDKTGTLTEGKQGVVDVVTTGMSQEQAVSIAASVEGDSEHMIARAIRNYAEEQHVKPAPVSDFESLAGRGVKAKIEDGMIYFVGGPRLLEQQGWLVPQTLRAAKQKAEDAGQSVVYLASEDGVVALFAIADVIRAESYEAVKQLHALGLKVAMLTGDSEAVARAVAKELNIDIWFAQALPENKADKVKELRMKNEELRKDGKHHSPLSSRNSQFMVAMVGDGVNDAPALATADVGIAIGAGTDVAIESAGIILVRSNPLDIVKIIQLSRATYRKMQQNLVWATGYNVVAIPLAMGALAPWGITLDPAVGALFMSLSTVIVAINAQTLRRITLDEIGAGVGAASWRTHASAGSAR